MKVSIIIPTATIWVSDYHKIFSNCIEAIERNADYQNYEIIIIDNVMKGEPARNVIKECQAKGYKVIPYPFKFHRSKALNLAAQHADGEYMLFLDSDTVPQKGFLKILVETLEMEEKIKIKVVGPRIITKNKYGFDHFTTGYIKSHGRVILADENFREDNNRVKVRIALPLYCLLVDKKTFDEVGGFDESYRFYNADIDLCLKINTEGYKCVVDKTALVSHHGGLTTGGFKDLKYPRSFDDIVLNRKWADGKGKKKNKGKDGSKKELLIIKLLTIGDAVLVTPSIKAIKEKYPSHRITLITCKGWKDIFEGNPYIDELVAVDKRNLSLPDHIFYDEITSEWLKKKDWDRVIQFNCLDFNGGYWRTGLHFRDFYAEMGGVYPLKDTRYFIPVTDEHRKNVDEMLKQYKIGSKIICIHTKGGWDRWWLKNWSTGKWLEFAEAIYNQHNCKLILVGGKGEEIDSPYIINLAGKLGIKELVALLEKADLFIGLDSGPMHIASAANAPIIALFSVTHAKVGTPNCDNYITIQAPFSCEVPCALTSCYKGVTCRDSISVDTVLSAVEKMLNRQGNIQEDWKGDEPAKIFFKDWEWHTVVMESHEDKKFAKVSPQKIKILYQARENIFEQSGIDTEILLNLDRYMKKAGYKVDFSSRYQESLENFDIVHILGSDIPFAINASIQKKPYIITPLHDDLNKYYLKSMEVVSLFQDYLHSSDSGIFEKGLSKLNITEDNFKTNPQFKFIVSTAEAILVNSKPEEHAIRRDIPSPGSIMHAELGFTPSKGSENISSDLFISKYGVKDFVLCAGNLGARENQLMLLYALKNDDIPVVFINNKTLQIEYEDLCKKFKRKGKTIFTGRISREMLFSAYKCAKVFVMPSWYDLSADSFIEAAWFGCNIVASSWGAVKEYVGEYAFYCEPHNPESIRKAVIEAINTPSRTVSREILQKFSWENTAEKVLSIYEDVIANCNTEDGKQRLINRANIAQKEIEFYRLQERADNLLNVNPEDTRDLVSQILNTYPDDPAAYFSRGTAYFLLAMYPEAESDLKKALSLNPAIDLNAHLYLCQVILMRTGQYEEAIKILEKTFKIYPFTPEETRNRIYGLLKRYNEEISRIQI